tara:strand:+ start:9788 stop:10858 length:1071 start_codon:yes stop_codon:yes gene_type:complete
MSFAKVTYLIALILLLGLKSSLAQVNQSQALLIEKVISQLEQSMSDIPSDVKRVAIYRLNYNKNLLSNEDLNYITARIESTFRNFGALTILSPRELEPTDELKVFGRDSTIQISNLKGRSLAESNTELLTETAAKYSIQGLIEITIQARPIEGYALTFKMIRPESQEVVWVKGLVSNPIFPKEEKDKGKLTFLSFGVETLTGSSFTIDSTTTDAEQQILSYNANLLFRQPIDLENSGYLGLKFGVNLLKGVDDSLYNATLINIGTVFHYGLGEKKESINANRLLLTLEADVRFALSKYQGSIFTVSPGLQFNFTRSISIAMYARNIISGDELREKDENKSITYNKLSYGLQYVFRF